MKRLFSIFLAFALTFGLTVAPISVQPALANPGTIYVSVSGSDSSGDGTAGNPYRTIQKAINVAISGDTIKVAAGTYPEKLTLKSEAVIVTIQGAGASTTTIDGLNSGRVIYANGAGPGTVIDGFTVTKGKASPAGGGFFIAFCPSVTISNCIITSNNGTVAGGGLYLQNSNATIVNCVIANNSATNGGGIYFNLSPSASYFPKITNCTIANNMATTG